MSQPTDRQPAPLLSIALRGGDTLDLWPDRLTAGGQSFPLAELRQVRLTGDPAQPLISLGLPGHTVALPLADPPDAPRLLEAILARRPDLRGPPAGAGNGYAPPPPPPGYAPPGYAPPGYAPPPPGYGYGYFPPSAMRHPSGIPDSERILAGVCHLSVFFAPLLLPLVVWLAAQNSSPYASRQGKQAFFFHLLYGLGVAAVILVLVVFVVGVSAASAARNGPDAFGSVVFAPVIAIILAGIGAVVQIGFGIYGAVQAFNGRPFHYPLLGGL